LYLFSGIFFCILTILDGIFLFTFKLQSVANKNRRYNYRINIQCILCGNDNLVSGNATKHYVGSMVHFDTLFCHANKYSFYFLAPLLFLFDYHNFVFKIFDNTFYRVVFLFFFFIFFRSWIVDLVFSFRSMALCFVKLSKKFFNLYVRMWLILGFHTIWFRIFSIIFFIWNILYVLLIHLFFF
jgi:hypothetical protein